MLVPGDPIRKMISPAVTCHIRARATIESRSSVTRPRNRALSASNRRAPTKKFRGNATIATPGHAARAKRGSSSLTSDLRFVVDGTIVEAAPRLDEKAHSGRGAGNGTPRQNCAGAAGGRLCGRTRRQREAGDRDGCARGDGCGNRSVGPELGRFGNGAGVTRRGSQNDRVGGPSGRLR